MTWVKRVAPLAAAVTIAAGGIADSAVGATSTTKWTTKQCTAYKTSFLKKHKKPTKAQLAAGNKVLKRHSCTIKA
jgi:hypothetical protein